MGGKLDPGQPGGGGKLAVVKNASNKSKAIAIVLVLVIVAMIYAGTYA